MKLRKKLLSIIMSLALFATLINLPVLTSAFASADAVSVSVSDQFSVKKELDNKNFDLASDDSAFYTISFADYVTAGAEVCLWAPDRSDLTNGFKSVVGLSYVFKYAGVYAVQYRYFSKGFYTYSDQYHINVNNSMKDIVLKETLSSTAKMDSVVKIPNATDSDVNVNVFDSYGNEIPTNTVDGYKTFTNTPKLAGVYYIQYSKNVTIAGEGVQAYKYLTITFGKNYAEAQLTELKKEYSFSYGSSVADLVKNGYVYLFKNYDFSKIKVVDENNETVTTATVKYWVKSNDDSTVLFSVNNGDTVLTLTDLSKITKQSWTGETYNLTISCEEFGLKEEIKITEKINFDAITFGYANGINPYENLGVDTDYSADLTLTLASGYSEEFLKIFDGGKRNFVLRLYDSGKNELAGTTEDVEGTIVTKYTFNAGTANEFFIETAGAGIKFTNFNDKIESGTYYRLNVSIEQTYTINGNEGTYNKSFGVRLAKESNDVQAPQTIKFGSYDKIIKPEAGGTAAKFVLPTVSAKDYDNNGEETSGVIVSILINDETEYTHKIGEEVTLTEPTNKIVYKIADACGNETIVTIYVKVDVNYTAAPSITISPNLEKLNGEYTLELGVAGLNAKIFGKDEIPFSAKVENGTSTFKTSASKFVVVVSEDNGNETTYVGICDSTNVMGEADLPKLYEAYVSNNTAKALYSGQRISVTLGDTCLWFGDQNFSIESENGLYTISRINEIKFLKTGTYRIVGLDGKAATIVVNRPSSINVVLDRQIKLVGKQNTTVDLVKPTLENCFGYTLRQLVKTSDGKIVELTDAAKLPLYLVEQYTIENEFSFSGVTKSKSMVVSSGDVSKPTITITNELKNETWKGEKIRYCLSDATAVDKKGNDIVVTVSVEDANGRKLEIITIDGKKYVDISAAGIYTVYYEAVDVDGVKQIETVNFAVTYPEEKTTKKLPTGAIVGIVLGSVAFAGLVCLVVLLIVKNKKKQNKFINKGKQEKKQQKRAEKNTDIFTIAEGKDGKVWLVKKNNQIILKAKTKDEATEYALAERGEFETKIKVYNQKGRLIDSL